MGNPRRTVVWRRGRVTASLTVGRTAFENALSRLPGRCCNGSAWVSGATAGVGCALLFVVLLLFCGRAMCEPEQSHAVTIAFGEMEPVAAVEPLQGDPPLEEPDELAELAELEQSSEIPDVDWGERIAEEQLVVLLQSVLLPEPVDAEQFEDLQVVEFAPVSPERVAVAAAPVDNVASNFFSSVYASIAEEVRYPAIAKARGVEGRVWLVLAIDVNGEMVECGSEEVAEGVLLRAAVAAARRASPFSAPPEGLSFPVSVTVPVVVRMGGG